MPVDYSKFADIEDSDEEPIWVQQDGKQLKGITKKTLDGLQEGVAAIQTPGRRTFCFLDFEVDAEALRAYADEVKFEVPQKLGRVVVELDQAAHAPMLCENFRSLCTGERGLGVGRNKLHYRGRKVSMILPKYCLQVSIANEYSCFGRYLEDEKLRIPSVSFDKSGLLAVGNHGPNTNTCTFMLLLNEAQHLDGYNQIIGRVVQGMEVCRLIEQLPTDRKEKSFLEKNVKSHWGGKPMVDITVADCGELPEDQACHSALDGDSFPEFAEDYSCRSENDELYGAAETLRELGNGFFKTGDFPKALEKYEKAMRYLAPLLKKQHIDQEVFEQDAREWVNGAVIPKDRTDVVRANLMIQLNVCQVLLSMRQWHMALIAADNVVTELVGRNTKKTRGALPIDPLTVKALFRRARAREGISEVPGEVTQWEEAIRDLQQALTVEPENQELRKELLRLQQKQHRADRKGQAVYERMLRPEDGT